MNRGWLARTIILACLAGVSLPCFGQTASNGAASNRAVLQTGPTRTRGLLFLPINVIDHYIGEYRTTDGMITVYYTETAIEPFEEWGSYTCGNKQLRIVEASDQGTIVYLVHDEPWELFVKGERGDLFCSFIDVFIRRLRYFQEVTVPGSVPPFPAILDLR